MPMQLYSRWMRWSGLALLLGLVLLSAGCGGTGTISGKVYYKDQPLPGGTVIFTNADGKGSRTGPIQPDGSYTIEDMPIGTAKIGVETESINPDHSGGGRMTPPPSGQAPGRGGPPPMMMPPTDKIPAGADPSKIYGRSAAGQYVEIPKDYGDPNSSEQSMVVKRGPQTYEIRLK